MRFFLVDDDEAIRSMLTEIIEDFDLGKVVGEAENGSLVDAKLLKLKKADVLIIDLLMPIKDGIQTVRDLNQDFDGKIIMLSQVEDKEIIGKAYSLGVEYYITKPINRLEVIGIVNKVAEHLQLQKSINDIHRTLSGLDLRGSREKRESALSVRSITESGQHLLSELGMIGEAGCRDLLEILTFLQKEEGKRALENEFPSLKEIFTSIAVNRLGESDSGDIKKEVKATEQRIRRAILQALNHLASLGLTDYSNPKFEEYASKFFDFTEVRKKMMELEDNIESSKSSVSINIKKFVRVLYLESKKAL